MARNTGFGPGGHVAVVVDDALPVLFEAVVESGDAGHRGEKSVGDLEIRREGFG